jgi:acetyl esterase
MMELDPGAAAVLQALRDNNIPEWHTLVPVEARKVYEARVALFAGTPSPVGSVEDLSIEGPGGPLRLRLYRPAGEGPVPILVYLHGGGWTLGSLDSHDELCRRLCRAAGALVIAVDYRLAPEHPYPAALDDSLAVVAWAAANGAAHGGDPENLTVGGDSAGGNLTAGLCLYIRDHGGPAVRLQVLIYPAVRASFETLSFYENAEDKLLTAKDTIWFWHNFLGPNRPGEDQYAEPGWAQNLDGLPPALIITGGHDPVRDDGEIFASRLARAGNRVELKRYGGMIHGFMGLPVELPDGKDAVELVARAIHGGVSAS